MNPKMIVLSVSIGFNIFLGVFGGYDYLPDAYKDAVGSIAVCP